MRPLRVAQITLLTLSALLLSYLVVLALRPHTRPPEPLAWFGKPGDWRTIAIVTVVVGALCVLSYRTRRNKASATVPVVIVVGLFAIAFVLGFSTYWSCSSATHPTFFTTLEWTVSLIKGGIEEKNLGSGTPCPSDPPAALHVARLAILAAFAVSIIGVATAAFRMQSDRIRTSFARSITAVVDIDEDAESMVSAIAQTSAYQGTLALLTTSPDQQAVQECRTKGARILPVDFSRPETVGNNRFWRRVNRLYLLSPDPSVNLARLRVINSRLSDVAARHRIPLIIRIDDPWLAKAWRAEQFGGSDTRWAADSVGKYEVTARRLLDQILAPGNITRILVCGTSRLTLALCADMGRRQTERDYYPAGAAPLPELTLVDLNAAEYRRDHEFHEEQRGFGTSHADVAIVEDVPSEPLLSSLIDGLDGGVAATAVVFVDSFVEPTTATRLAARFTGLSIYVWDPQASVAAESVPVVGQLRSYRLGIDLPAGQAHDNWERAARLIHERYVSTTKRDKPSLLPWEQLDEFYRESNRRQVRNALWMVEQLAGHTWNTWGSPQDASPAELAPLPPLDQLRRLGFADDAAYAMARAEFEDWSRYLRQAGWHGPDEGGGDMVHEKLVSWEKTLADDDKRDAALRSLATTLIQLRELGYRSRPLWRPYRRVGSVTAKRRGGPWSWQTASGDTMDAQRGAWEVQDDAGSRWSVRDDIFRSSYRKVGAHRWNAWGTVLARPAEPGETIDSLEGPSRAAKDGWVLQGDSGEQWSVDKEKFAARYEGPVSFADRFDHWNELLGNAR